MRAPSISPQAFRRLALAAVIAYALLVATGGAVRLTGSGLGCPDWPSCTQQHFTSALSFHPLVEFGNRLVTVAVSIISVAVFLGAMWRRPKRTDLRWLAGGVLLGLVAQIVLGGLVVLFKLNPYLVALHFVLTLVVLADAIVLYQNAGYESAPRRTPLVGGELVWFGRLQLGVIALVVLAGTIVTGSGPHAGAPGAKRIGIAFRDIAELHSTIALFLIGLTLGGLFALHLAKAPPAIQRRARTVLEIYAIQGALGFTQYFLHDAAGVVEVHLIGATAAFSATLISYLGLFASGTNAGTRRSDEHNVALAPGAVEAAVIGRPGEPAPVGR